jgi:hypothetical protein
VAWLVALIAYRLPFRLTGGKFIPGPIPVPVILRAVVPVISVLTVPFGTNTGVIRTRNRARPGSFIRKTSPFIGSIEAFLDTLSYSNTLSSGLWYMNIRGLELLLKLPSKLRIKGYS